MIRSVRSDGTLDAGGVFGPIERPRVVERITVAASQRVVLILAPAGYGKSVALRQFLQTVADPYVLYALRPDHTGLLGFLRGLADALEGVSPDARATLAGAYECNAGSYAPGNDLAIWLDSHLETFRGIIAIDELHIAQDDREVTRFLAALVERTRGRIQWVVGSRSARGLPIGTWLAYGESGLAIDEHDLRFTADEAGTLARALHLRVRDSELRELLQVTDGWATAMSFALRNATRSTDLRSIASSTREMIYRYLAEQVYRTLADEERAFLESSALLESIEINVMVAAGFKRASAQLEDLRHRVAFLHVEDDGKGRCHDLFRDFLIHEFNQKGADVIAAERTRLATVLEKLHRLPAALRMYAAAGSGNDIERILRIAGFDLLAKGHADAVSTALAALKPSSARTSAIVLGLQGMLLLSAGQQEEGERRIAQALAENIGAKLRAELALPFAALLVNRHADGEAIALLDGLLARGTFRSAQSSKHERCSRSCAFARGRRCKH